MKAENVKTYLKKLKNFNDWELEQRRNYDPKECVKRVFALYEFAMNNFSQKKIEKHHKEHLDHLIYTQQIYQKIKEKK